MKVKRVPTFIYRYLQGNPNSSGLQLFTMNIATVAAVNAIIARPGAAVI